MLARIIKRVIALKFELIQIQSLNGLLNSILLILGFNFYFKTCFIEINKEVKETVTIK